MKYNDLNEILGSLRRQRLQASSLFLSAVNWVLTQRPPMEKERSEDISEVTVLYVSQV